MAKGFLMARLCRLLYMLTHSCCISWIGFNKNTQGQINEREELMELNNLYTPPSRTRVCLLSELSRVQIQHIIFDFEFKSR